MSERNVLGMQVQLALAVNNSSGIRANPTKHDGASYSISELKPQALRTVARRERGKGRVPHAKAHRRAGCGPIGLLGGD